MQPQSQSQTQTPQQQQAASTPTANGHRAPPPPHANSTPAQAANFPPPYRSPPNPGNAGTPIHNGGMMNGANGFGGSKHNLNDSSSQPHIGYRHTLTGENGQQMQNSLKGMMLMGGNKNQTLDSAGQSMALQQLRNGGGGVGGGGGAVGPPKTPQSHAERLQSLQSRLPLPGDTYVSPDNLRDAANRIFTRNQNDRASFGQTPQSQPPPPPGAQQPQQQTPQFSGDSGYYQNGAAFRSARDTINSRMAKQQQQQQQQQQHHTPDDAAKRNSFANHSFRQATLDGGPPGKQPPMVPPKPQSRSTSRERLGEEVDNLDAELKHILRSEGLMQRRSVGGGGGGGTTPPLPALSLSPGPQKQPKQQQAPHKPDLLNTSSGNLRASGTGKSGGGGKRQQQQGKGSKQPSAAAIGALSLDLESVLGLQTQTDLTSDESTTVDAGDAAAIRKQLDGLEGMYSEVLKLLGVRKYGRAPYGHGMDKRTSRKMYGSMSSLPSVSSIGSRHLYKDKGAKLSSSSRPKERNTNKRFQRLESHVVTLARSVAHLGRKKGWRT